VAEINIASRHEELPSPVQSIRAVAGSGLMGDRNFLADGDEVPDRDADLTLVASETLEALAEETGLWLTAAESRRNLYTRHRPQCPGRQTVQARRGEVRRNRAL
jgi:hypothetical protein